MNDLYVNVKVDREERPDLDKVYQTAHQLFTGQAGGWPLTVFLTPDDHVPIFTGHLLPEGPPLRDACVPRGARGRREVLPQRSAPRSARAARGSPTRSSKSRRAPRTTSRRSRARRSSAQSSGSRRATTASTAASATRRNFRTRPHSSCCSRKPSAAGAPGAIRSARRASRRSNVVMHSLDRMALAGLFDQLGGGFFRYSVDREWSIPHFEKMLYDNAALLSLYAETFAATYMPLYWPNRERNGGLGDPRHAVPGGRLLCHARRGLRARGRQVLRLDAAGIRRAAAGEREPHREARARSHERGRHADRAQLRASVLASAPSGRAAGGRRTARPRRGECDRAVRRGARTTARRARAARSARPGREDPHFVERAHDLLASRAPRDGSSGPTMPKPRRARSTSSARGS